jgi:hypothetical protein
VGDQRPEGPDSIAVRGRSHSRRPVSPQGRHRPRRSPRSPTIAGGPRQMPRSPTIAGGRLVHRAIAEATSGRGHLWSCVTADGGTGRNDPRRTISKPPIRGGQRPEGRSTLPTRASLHPGRRGPVPAWGARPVRTEVPTVGGRPGKCLTRSVAKTAWGVARGEPAAVPRREARGTTRSEFSPWPGERLFPRKSIRRCTHQGPSALPRSREPPFPVQHVFGTSKTD